MHHIARPEAVAAALARAIGTRVRHERQALGWTLDQLAAAAGVSRRMLVNVEHGDANPSIATLLKISDALGVGLPALVEPPRPNAIKITRAGEGAALWYGEAGGRGVLVAGTEPPDVVELWDWTLAPGDRHESDAHTPGTTELLQVLNGTLVVEIAGEAITLDSGDAITFASDVPHAYASSGEQETRFSLAVYEPGVGATTRPERDHA
jgi:transcriptional regulator with XRE-family HTH domain